MSEELLPTMAIKRVKLEPVKIEVVPVEAQSEPVIAEKPVVKKTIKKGVTPKQVVVESVPEQPAEIPVTNINVASEPPKIEIKPVVESKPEAIIAPEDELLDDIVVAPMPELQDEIKAQSKVEVIATPQVATNNKIHVPPIVTPVSKRSRGLFIFTEENKKSTQPENLAPKQNTESTYLSKILIFGLGFVSGFATSHVIKN